MVEQTFGGASGFGFDFWRGMVEGSGEFAEIGRDLFDGDDLIYSIMRAFLALFCKGGIVGGGQAEGHSLDDFMWIYQDGPYIPCVKRTVFTGQFDLKNDEKVSSGSLAFLGEDDSDVVFTVLRQRKPPKGWAALPGHTPYALTIYYDSEEMLNKAERRRMGGSAPKTAAVVRVSMSPNGVFTPMKTPSGYGGAQWSQALAAGCAQAAIVANAIADQKHLWCVRTEEEVIRGKTPLTLGVSPEHVKSLFYARNLPVTESGRRKPILHWVRAHQRRMREGTDIDVRKHLRGVTEFEMEGFPFRITNPVKEALGHKPRGACVA